MESKLERNESITMTIDQQEGSAEKETLTLKLVPKKHIQWAEDVVNNEFLNKKSSKRCCIFHKKREFGESSSDSDSDDDRADHKHCHHKKKDYPDYQTYHA